MSSKRVDYLVIGGSAAGTTAAEVIRSLAPASTITIVTDEPNAQYSRVLIPHYIRRKVEREQVFLKKPQWYQEKNVELVKEVRAQSLEVSKKVVKFSNGEEIEYGKLLIAVGGNVIPLATPGADLENILYMRTVDDADRIIKVAKQSKSAVIVGGGFIGLEYASCFKANGVKDITMIVREPYFWSMKLDEQSSRVLVSTLAKNGIKVLTGEEVDHFESKSSGTIQLGVEPLTRSVGTVKTKSGKSFEADVVGVGIGIRSDLRWLEGSGLEINRGIVTNEYLETNVPNVYAAGDCAEFYDVLFEQRHLLGNWANATSQGNAVGKTIGGEKTVYETASSYSITFFEPPNNGSCSFIGVTDKDYPDEIVSRGSVESNIMTRIFIKTIDGVVRVVGATVINNPREVSPLTSAIKTKINVSSFKDKLADVAFDLNELVVS